MWPSIGRHLEIKTEGPASEVDYVSLQERFSDADALWHEICVRERLKVNSLVDLVSWEFGDYVFKIDWDVMADTIKCRHAGFLEFVDSEKMFMNRLEELKNLHIIP